MRLDGYLGTNCPYEEIFPQLVEELQWSYMACTFSSLIKFIIFLKEQAEIPPGLYP